MKFKYFKIKDFLSFGSDFSFDCDQALSIVVGSNNSGKTNLFRAVTFLSEILRSRNMNYTPYYRNGNLRNAFEVRIGFKLNDEEIQAITDFLVLTLLKEQPQIPEGANKNILLDISARIAYISEGFFKRFLNENCEFVIRSYVNPQYAPNIFLAIGGARKLYYDIYGGQLTLDPKNNYNQVNFTQLFVNKLREDEPAMFEQASFRGLDDRITQILSALNMDWLIARLDSSTDSRPASIWIQPISFNIFSLEQQEGIVLKRLRNFLYERNVGLNDVALLHMIRAIYETSIVRLSDVRSYGKYVLPEDFDSIPTSIDLNRGSELATILFRLKNSSDHKERHRYQLVRDSFKRIFGSDFDVALHTIDETIESRQLGLFPLSSLGNNQQMNALTAPIIPDTKVIALDERPEIRKRNEISIYVTKNNHQVDIEYAAAGYFETLLIVFLITGIENKLIFLDEPALNLHPTKQKEIFESIIECSNNNQVFLITHSPYFVDYRYLNNVTRFALEDTGTTAYKLKFEDTSTGNWFNKELINNPKFASLLFANKVLLVEGNDEEAGLPIWLKKLGLNIEEKNIQVINIIGDNRYDKYANLLSDFKIPYKFVGDKKAGTKVHNHLENTLIYQKDDFSDLYPQEVLKRAVDIFGESKKDPGIAIYVTENSDPPEEIKALIEKLEEFSR